MREVRVNPITYWLLFVDDDAPTTHGPYESPADRDEAVKVLHGRSDGDGTFFALDINLGVPTFDSYPGWFFSKHS